MENPDLHPIRDALIALKTVLVSVEDFERGEFNWQAIRDALTVTRQRMELTKTLAADIAPPELRKLDTLLEYLEQAYQVDDPEGLIGPPKESTIRELTRLTWMFIDAGPSTATARHADDFRSVLWFGETHIFSPTQAAVIEVMWRHWTQGTPAMAEHTILESGGSHAGRLRDVFDKGKHSAWGRMIQPAGKGAFKLEKPSNP